MCEFIFSGLSYSTGKCRNCKAGHRDLRSNPGPYSFV